MCHFFVIPCSILVDSAFRLALIGFVCLNWKFDSFEEFRLWVLKCHTDAMKKHSYKYLGFHIDQELGDLEVSELKVTFDCSLDQVTMSEI